MLKNWCLSLTSLSDLYGPRNCQNTQSQILFWSWNINKYKEQNLVNIYIIQRQHVLMYMRNKTTKVRKISTLLAILNRLITFCENTKLKISNRIYQQTRRGLKSIIDYVIFKQHKFELNEVILMRWLQHHAVGGKIILPCKFNKNWWWNPN